MKQRDSIFPGVQSLILIVAAITGSLSQTSYCRTARLEDVTLFIQHTPTEGGTITPSAGVHHFAPNSQVTLTAVPRSGYQFVYWLGDVGDPTAGSTTVLLDKPKVVIAVFESLEQDYCTRGSSAGGAGGGMIAAGSEFGQQGWMESHSRPIEPTRPSLPRFPAADVPEPATLLVLSLGGVMLLRRTR